MSDTADLLTTPQAAERLGITHGAVRKLASDGKLRPASERWRGRLLLFASEEVERYSRERRPRGNPAIAELRRNTTSRAEIVRTSEIAPSTP